VVKEGGNNILNKLFAIFESRLRVPKPLAASDGMSCQSTQAFFQSSLTIASSLLTTLVSLCLREPIESQDRQLSALDARERCHQENLTMS
jgi:hypothetical protein